MPDYQARKVTKKQHRCQAIIQREQNVQSSTSPTKYLAVLNAGLSCGLTEEQVLEAATRHGKVQRLLMVPNKSYCFLECCSALEADKIYQGMHNHAPIGQGGAIAYLAFFEQLPEISGDSMKPEWPAGLLVLENFVSATEEQLLLESIGGVGDESCTGDLKHRRVKHFGYEFLYTTNNVDVSQPLQQNIPIACDVLWPRLQQVAAEKDFLLDWQQPDQLTINEYMPGQGIPPHVDTHSAFLEPILSLSLLGDTVMDFRRGKDRVAVMLPRRSLLVMSGEARYDWTHGITPRMLDIVCTPSGSLTTKMRTKRVSLTFRRLRRGPCECMYPTLCDTHAQKTTEKKPTQLGEEEAKSLELKNVHAVYDHIASHFSETRHTPWPKVAAFLESFSPGSIVIDVGCGNGKYLDCNREMLTIGCDRSRGLLEACRTAAVKTRRNVFQCDCLNVPLRTQSADGCISIAVIHHLATAERRLAAVKEMARLLRPNGRALIYVWARNQHSSANNKKSSYLLQNKAINKQKITADQQRQLTEQQWQNTSPGCDLPIHTNRTDFQQQDVLVPWKLKNSATTNGDTQSFLRFYHVFEEGELERLVAQVPDVDLLHSYYDQGNHCVIFQRRSVECT